jgi:hypothetical protein
VKEGWQRREERIFEWFNFRGIRMGDPENIKECYQGEYRKNIAIKTQHSKLSAS